MSKLRWKFVFNLSKIEFAWLIYLFEKLEPSSHDEWSETHRTKVKIEKRESPTLLWKYLLRISSIRHKNSTRPWCFSNNCSPFCSWKMYTVTKMQIFTKNSFAKLTDICAFVYMNLSFCSFVKFLEKLI